MDRRNIEKGKINRREWLKAAAGMLVAATTAPLADGASPTAGVRLVEPGDVSIAKKERCKVGKIAVREQVGCVECDACMPCGYGVDIPGNFKIYNELLAHGYVPDPDNDDENSVEFRLKAVNFLRTYDSRIADRHQSQRCIKCFHCVNECRHGVFIVNELAELTALTDALRDWECRLL